MLRLTADENFNNDIVRGLIRRNPDVDIVRVQDVGLCGADDPAVLEWAANQGRVLVTHDVSMLSKHAYERVAAGQPMAGVFEVGTNLSVAHAIDDLLLIVECSCRRRVGRAGAVSAAVAPHTVRCKLPSPADSEVTMWKCLAATLLACASAIPPHALQAGRAPKPVDELRRLYETRDYFALRDRLAESSDSTQPEARFYRAADQHAFNEPNASNSTIRALLADDTLSEHLVAELLILKRRNDIRLSRYREAALDATKLLASPGVDPEEMEDARNERKLLEALADVPPQQAALLADSEIRLQRSSMGGRCVPVRIDSSLRCFITDTGANFSVLIASEAKALGLRVRRASLHVGTSTDQKVTADVAVADHVTLGRIEYRDVVFLVLPDALLTFPDGGRIPGILGFPVIEAMGQVGFRRDGVLTVPKIPAPHPGGTMALHGLTLLTRVQYGNAAVVCKVDSGAGRTAFYEPFFQRFRAEIERLGTSRTAKVGGAGGIREIPAVTLPDIDVQVGGRRVHLKGIDVYTTPIVATKENQYHCNLGLDVLDQFGEYILNFRTMSLVLADGPRGADAPERGAQGVLGGAADHR